jgi:hypothetical protein
MLIGMCRRVAKNSSLRKQYEHCLFHADVRYRSMLVTENAVAGSARPRLMASAASSGTRGWSVDRVAWAGNSAPSLRVLPHIGHSGFLVVRDGIG